MTRSQLTYLYAFANLPYSEESKALVELKKILLLELKVNSSIHISGKEWYKNDILTFFETSIDQNFDYDAFVSDYPWIENLKFPDNISYDKKLLSIDFSDDRFQQFAKNESRQYEGDYLRSIKRYLKEAQDYYAASLLLYKKCFTPVFQLKLENEIKTALNSRFNHIIALSSTTPQKELMNKQGLFFRRAGFYKLMKEIEDDSELLDLNIEALYYVVNKSSEFRQINAIVTEQLNLPHSLEGLNFLKHLKQQVESTVPNQEVDWNTILRVIFMIFFILIIVSRVIK